MNYAALLAPGTDETLRFADEVRQDVEETGSVALLLAYLAPMAMAVRPVDPDRALVVLDEVVELATRANLPVSLAVAEFYRGIVFFTRRRYAEAAVAWRRALVVYHDDGSRRGTLNALSCVTGLADRTGRPETAAVLLAGVRAARDEYRFPGSANERHAEHTIEEHLQQQLGSESAAHPARRLDVEATIDLALDTLDDIAADSPA